MILIGHFILFFVVITPPSKTGFFFSRVSASPKWPGTESTRLEKASVFQTHVPRPQDGCPFQTGVFNPWIAIGIDS
jgi:hypothetical protein